MANENEAPGRGLNEPAQADIESVALELARAAGRTTMNEYDLARAREEILGKSSVKAVQPTEQPGVAAADDQMPS